MKYGQELIAELEKELAQKIETARERSERIYSGQTDEEDCFLSIKANAAGQAVTKAKIDLLKKGGTTTYEFLATPDGKILNAKQIETKYGESWIINHADGTVSFCPTFNPFGRTATKIYKKYGFKTFEEVKEKCHVEEFLRIVYDEAKNAHYASKGFKIVYEERPTWVTMGSDKIGFNSFPVYFESDTNYATGESNTKKGQYASNN